MITNSICKNVTYFIICSLLLLTISSRDVLSELRRYVDEHGSVQFKEVFKTKEEEENRRKENQKAQEVLTKRFKHSREWNISKIILPPSTKHGGIAIFGKTADDGVTRKFIVRSHKDYPAPKCVDVKVNTFEHVKYMPVSSRYVYVKPGDEGLLGELTFDWKYCEPSNILNDIFGKLQDHDFKCSKYLLQRNDPQVIFSLKDWGPPRKYLPDLHHLKASSRVLAAVYHIQSSLVPDSYCKNEDTEESVWTTFLKAPGQPVILQARKIEQGTMEIRARNYHYDGKVKAISFTMGKEKPDDSWSTRSSKSFKNEFWSYQSYVSKDEEIMPGKSLVLGRLTIHNDVDSKQDSADVSDDNAREIELTVAERIKSYVQKSIDSDIKKARKRVQYRLFVEDSDDHRVIRSKREKKKSMGSDSIEK